MDHVEFENIVNKYDTYESHINYLPTIDDTHAIKRDIDTYYFKLQSKLIKKIVKSINKKKKQKINEFIENIISIYSRTIKREKHEDMDAVQYKT